MIPGNGRLVKIRVSSLGQNFFPLFSAFFRYQSGHGKKGGASAFPKRAFQNSVGLGTPATNPFVEAALKSKKSQDFTPPFAPGT
jgi:hypothetical protein